MKRPVKVLIVDDSALVRQTLSEVLASDPDIAVLGTASDPFVAARRIQTEVPDVITLDVEMPRMDGITFLRKLMAQRPIPVVMCSSLTEHGSETLMQALEAGAVDIILKPRMGTARFLQESKLRICEAVKAAAQARVQRRSTERRVIAAPPRKLSADAMLRNTQYGSALSCLRDGISVATSIPVKPPPATTTVSRVCDAGWPARRRKCRSSVIASAN